MFFEVLTDLIGFSQYGNDTYLLCLNVWPFTAFFLAIGQDASNNPYLNFGSF